MVRSVLRTDVHIHFGPWSTAVFVTSVLEKASIIHLSLFNGHLCMDIIVYTTGWNFCATDYNCTDTDV